MHSMRNPLLKTEGLPAFASITAADVKPAVEYLIAENKKQVNDLLTDGNNNYNWDNLVQRLEDLDDLLNKAWSPASHLHAVADHATLRKAYNACLPLLSDYATELGQNEALFNAYQSLADSAAFKTLTVAQRKIINNALRDFRLSGIELDTKGKQRYRELQQRLSKLQTRFEENLLDATQAWKKLITNKNDLSGLPDSAIESAAYAAHKENKTGWLFTLDFPSYLPLMQNADNRALRREMYTAYVTRASNKGPDAGKWDNGKIMYAILKCRTEKARLLGFDSYAHYSLATKMAETPAEVMSFLNDLAARSVDLAKKEFQELKKYARGRDKLSQLAAWDIAYYSEKLRQENFAVSQETLRPYFPVNRVIEGLFAITGKLYDVAITERFDVEVWDEAVRFFDITDGNDNVIAGFYLDLYAREHKRGGAWMDECRVRKKLNGGIQNPVAYITCNFTPPVGNKQALLTHDEVTTLFHEFGHALQHTLTRVEYGGVSGINGVPWDAVELPSQFMENWCWEKEALDLFACHVETGERISEGLLEKMTRARRFQAGMQMVRQLEFALFDFRLHLEYAENPALDIQGLLNQVRAQVAVVKPPEFNQFQHGFSHIFAGGYAAGYYSYKWAEVLSADAFSRFEEKGIFDKPTGKEFLQSILEQGGSREPMDLFIEFRGRKPSIEPLLRHSGIA